MFFLTVYDQQGRHMWQSTLKMDLRSEPHLELPHSTAQQARAVDDLCPGHQLHEQ